jgi:prepilin-type N-terminal cleavage/methylation domain-containing protein
MSAIRRSQRGFSLVELMMVIAIAGTLMAVSVPALMDLSESSKLNTASRAVERELQSARLKAVSTNRLLRVRLNCPAEGYFRTVEVLGSSLDSDSNRCLLTAYPFPAADTELATRPNHDGPLRILGEGATVTTAVIEFRPDGTAAEVVSDVAQNIGTSVSITVTRREKSRTVSINGAGRVQLQ